MAGPASCRNIDNLLSIREPQAPSPRVLDRGCSDNLTILVVGRRRSRWRPLGPAEPFGHKQLAGRCYERVVAGAPLLHVDVPQEDGSYVTKAYGTPPSTASTTPTRQRPGRWRSSTTSRRSRSGRRAWVSCARRSWHCPTLSRTQSCQTTSSSRRTTTPGSRRSGEPIRQVPPQPRWQFTHWQRWPWRPGRSSLTNASGVKRPTWCRSVRTRSPPAGTPVNRTEVMTWVAPGRWMALPALLGRYHIEVRLERDPAWKECWRRLGAPVTGSPPARTRVSSTNTRTCWAPGAPLLLRPAPGRRAQPRTAEGGTSPRHEGTPGGHGPRRPGRQSLDQWRACGAP